jgi:hypothetical protein
VALLLLPLALSLSKGAIPANAIVSCQGGFTTAGETACQIPANAATITITAVGGAGGLGRQHSGTAGKADQVQATVPLPLNGVGPGGTLYVEVGGSGGTGGFFIGGSGGANGGAAGGAGTSGGGGGGGASDVRTCSISTCTPLTSGNDSRQVVAGGGGGAASGQAFGTGGNGGSAQTDGTAGTGPGPNCSTAAQGGTSANGGGQGGAAGSGGVNCFAPTNGSNGARGSGGAGGVDNVGGSGGGGGGGYYFVSSGAA